jgi:two-component system KDP operon response regulator KdpE
MTYRGAKTSRWRQLTLHALRAAEDLPEVVLLDLGLPDLDGMEVLKRIREWSEVPIVILSVRDREEEKVAALDAGADDYVTKPFGSAELLARLRAASRRVQPSGAEALYRCGQVNVDLASREVRVKGETVHLTPIEYSLLRLLVTHAGKVLTHRQILAGIWGPQAGDATHHLRVHIAHLRDKLEEDCSTPTLIRTEPGIGYRLASGQE